MSATIDPDTVARRLRLLRDRLAAVGGEHVRVVAVTKGFGPDAIEAAHAAGIDDIGESYAQECEAKLALVDPQRRPRVHFIGALQRNKVRRLAAAVEVWQSVDRIEVGREIARRSPGAEVLVQVNISGEESKSGCRENEFADLVGGLRALGLEVSGVMGIGPLGRPEDARPGFKMLRALADHHELPVVSMGMSGDLEVAVEEGSTMVRVGRDLFGERPPARH